ncbi:MAG: hypothetical protein IKO10_14545 [Lachnospiraceae bacterium]|nr:hypothetical protein [Lachnospiraceae bacterium]
MSKSFEKEYKEMIRAEVPDLWDRIVAKLDEQEAAKANADNNINREVNTDNIVVFPKKEEKTEKSTGVSEAENGDKTEPKKRKFPWRYLGMMAAAVLCVLIAIPVMQMMRRAEGNAPAADTQGADSVHTAVLTSTMDPEVVTENADHSESALGSAAQNGATGVIGSAAGEILGGNLATGELKSTNSTDIQFQIVGNNKVSVWVAGSDSRGSRSGGSYTVTVENPYLTVGDDVYVFLRVEAGTTEEQLTQIMEKLSDVVDEKVSLELKSAEEIPVADRSYGEYAIVLQGRPTSGKLSAQAENVYEELKKYDFVTVKIFTETGTSQPHIIVQ